MSTCVAICLITIIFTAVMADDREKLRFKNGVFKIVQFTDLHLDDLDYLSESTMFVQKQILAAEDPDLVVMTGDTISGWTWDGSEGWFTSRWARAVQPMIDAQVPWAFACGNHDIEAEFNGREIIDLDRSYNLSLTQHGPSNISGTTNYNLPIYASDSDTAKANLWVFDTGRHDCNGYLGYGCMESTQIDWYLDQPHDLPSLAFFHIPIPEYLNLWNDYECIGSMNESDVCCSSYNTGLFAAAKQMGDIKAMFCGHDHSNDFSGMYEGITLAYGRKTGYGAPGPSPGVAKGARVIEITEEPFSYRTWIRNEYGDIEVLPVHAPGGSHLYYCCESITWLYYTLLCLGLSGIILAYISYIALSAYKKSYHLIEERNTFEMPETLN